MIAAISNGRRLAASGALAATGAGVAAMGLHNPSWIEWSIVGSAAVLGVAGLAMARKSIVGQVFARGAAWLVFAPTAIVAVLSTFVGHSPEIMAVALAASSGAALFLGRPMLHTPEARAEFAPSRFRSWLLAGVTASTAASMLTAFMGLDFLYRALHGAPWPTSFAVPVAFLALSSALLASAFGVLRMRTWGILLGALTSFVTLGAAAIMHDASGVALSLLAIPALLFFVLPVLVAKRDRASAERGLSTRVASEGASSLPSRVRIATDDAGPFADDPLEADDRSAPAPRARAQHA